ncbi:hypothetical protein [Alkalihalobacillus sp. 1P02AB]|uniref:hypothetical protein n=1 Tax=Alkalihalobacillus sp. 1P02AB TaxID=3132260 RepID=UPI0039A56A66
MFEEKEFQISRENDYVEVDYKNVLNYVLQGSTSSLEISENSKELFDRHRRLREPEQIFITPKRLHKSAKVTYSIIEDEIKDLEDELHVLGESGIDVLRFKIGGKSFEKFDEVLQYVFK